MIDPFDVRRAARTAFVLRSALVAGCIAGGCVNRAPDELFGDPVWTAQGAGGAFDAGRDQPPIDASAGGSNGGEGGGSSTSGATGGREGQDVGVRESSGTGGGAADATRAT